MIFSQQIDEGYAECSTLSAEASGGSRGGIKWVIPPPTSIQQFFAHEKNRQSLACVIYLPAVAPPEGEASPLWVDVQKLYI